MSAMTQNPKWTKGHAEIKWPDDIVFDYMGALQTMATYDSTTQTHENVTKNFQGGGWNHGFALWLF